MNNIRCWCGSHTEAGRWHYPGGDPENGPAHPADAHAYYATETQVLRLQAQYPHRLQAWMQYGECPVCAGDGCTADVRWESGPWEEPGEGVPAPLYCCALCGGHGTVGLRGAAADMVARYLRVRDEQAKLDLTLGPDL